MKIFIIAISVFLTQPIFSSTINSISGNELKTKTPTTVSAEGKKGLVVVFLSAKCPCSDSHIAELKDLYNQYKNFNFVAIHSNTDENTELTESYFAEATLPFKVIQDDGAKLADELKAFKTPHAYVFLPNGETAYQGGMSNSKDCKRSDRKYLREALSDLDQGKKVATPEGRTLGCSIARKKS